MTDILVVGAGPVGLTMAAELARHGARCLIVDRLAKPSPFCRAIGVTPRTLEVWDDMGVARPMIDAGLWIEGLRSVVQGQAARDVRFPFPDIPYTSLGLPQNETERVLNEHLGRFGIVVERGVALTGLTETDEGVETELTGANGSVERATFRYVVGCDGAHSAVRHAAGIAFEGEAVPVTFMLGDVHIAWDLPRGMTYRALRLSERGVPDMFVAIPLPEAARYRVHKPWPPRHLLRLPAAIMGCRPKHAGQASTICRQSPTHCAQRRPAFRTCAGHRPSGSACGWRSIIGRAACSSPATPRISIPRPVAKA